MQRKRRAAAVAVAVVAAAVLAMAGCTRPQAYGDENSIIVAVPPELWDSIADTVSTVLGPRIFTVRDERTFELTQIDPRDDRWDHLRRWKHVLIFGKDTDPWVAEPLAAADGRKGEARLPAMLQAQDIWARGQTVTLVRLPADGGAAASVQMVAPLHELLDAQFWRYAQQRMFVSGMDTALERRLAQEAGFRITLPTLYQETRSDSIYLFRNANPSPAELIRSVLVAWRSPPPDTVTRDHVLEWRREVGDKMYDPAQVMDSARVEWGWLQMDGDRALQVQAVWTNPPELGWPAGGPFISRIVLCPDQRRAYLLDAWLYAPGKSKYEYMIQLLTILDSFRCQT